jgi:hypothetical protein
MIAKLTSGKNDGTILNVPNYMDVIKIQYKQGQLIYKNTFTYKNEYSIFEYIGKSIKSIEK